MTSAASGQAFRRRRSNNFARSSAFSQRRRTIDRRKRAGNEAPRQLGGSGGPLGVSAEVLSVFLSSLCQCQQPMSRRTWALTRSQQVGSPDDGELRIQSHGLFANILYCGGEKDLDAGSCSTAIDADRLLHVLAGIGRLHVQDALDQADEVERKTTKATRSINVVTS